MVISGFQELKTQLREAAPQPAVVAAAHDEHTLEAVFQARRDGLISPILVGDVERIRSIARSQGEEIPQEALVQAGGEGECAQRSVDLIRQGRGKLLIKGMLQTGALLRAVVQPDTGIRASELLSHVAILDVPAYHKLMFVSDGGMVIAPDRNQKREILRNVLSLCRFLGYEQPKAAILCAAETVSPRMPETEDAAALKEEGARGDFGPCLVEGPISFDLATDRAAAEIKGYRSPVAGDAEIGWICILGAAPFALCGFFRYHGMTAEQFAWAWIKSELLSPKCLVFRSNSVYYELLFSSGRDTKRAKTGGKEGRR